MADSLKERLRGWTDRDGETVPLAREAIARIETLEKENWQHQTSLIARDNLHEGACLRITKLEAELREALKKVSEASERT